MRNNLEKLADTLKREGTLPRAVVTNKLDNGKTELPGGLHVGSVLAHRFQVEEVLGEGSQGVVYQCVDKKSKQRVAIKRMYVSGKYYEARTLEEVRLMMDIALAAQKPTSRFTVSCFSPPRPAPPRSHLCALLDAFDTLEGPEGRAQYRHIVMPLARTDLDAFSREAFLLKKPVSNVRCGANDITSRRVAVDLCVALHNLREAGIVHRDIKPANIIVELNDDGQKWMIADFGLACKLSDCQGDGAAIRCGTSGYWAPEIFLGYPYSVHSDAWALGVTLYEAMAGRTLFRGSTIRDVFKDVLRVVGPVPRDLLYGAPYRDWMQEGESELWEWLDDGVPDIPLPTIDKWLPGRDETLRAVIKGLLHLDPRKRLTAESALAMMATAGRYEWTHARQALARLPITFNSYTLSSEPSDFPAVIRRDQYAQTSLRPLFFLPVDVSGCTTACSKALTELTVSMKLTVDKRGASGSSCNTYTSSSEVSCSDTRSVDGSA